MRKFFGTVKTVPYIENTDLIKTKKHRVCGAFLFGRKFIR